MRDKIIAVKNALLINKKVNVFAIHCKNIDLASRATVFSALNANRFNAYNPKHRMIARAAIRYCIELQIPVTAHLEDFPEELPQQAA